MTETDRPPIRIAVSGIDGSGKTTLCERLHAWATAEPLEAVVVGNLPRAYRRGNLGVIDGEDPFVSSFFFNYAVESCGDPGAARFLFEAQYIDYVMAIEEVRLYHHTVKTIGGRATLLFHDRHVLDRR